MCHGTCLRAITGPCDSMPRKDSARVSIRGGTSRWGIAWPWRVMAPFVAGARAGSLSGARLIPTAKPGANDGLAPQMLDVDGFIARVEPYFAENGFFEKEISRRTEQFGHIAHVWSTYESRHHADDPEPFARGINSIQLFYDNNRWWIVNIYWQQESAIPDKYL